MKTPLKLILAASFFLAAGLSSCKKEENTPAEKTVAVKLAFDASGSSTTFPGITWTYAHLNIDNFNIGLYLDGKGVGGNVMEGPHNVDMLADNSSLIMMTFRTYYDFDEIKGVINLKPSEERPPLTLKALVPLPGGGQIPVEFYFNDEASLNLHVTNAKQLSWSNYEATIHFEVDKLFAAIDYSTLPSATKTDGKIIISKTSNVALYNQAKAALNTSYSITLD